MPPLHRTRRMRSPDCTLVRFFSEKKFPPAPFRSKRVHNRHGPHGAGHGSKKSGLPEPAFIPYLSRDASPPNIPRSVETCASSSNKARIGTSKPAMVGLDQLTIYQKQPNVPHCLPAACLPLALTQEGLVLYKPIPTWRKSRRTDE